MLLIITFVTYIITIESSFNNEFQERTPYLISPKLENVRKIWVYFDVGHFHFVTLNYSLNQNTYVGTIKVLFMGLFAFMNSNTC